MTGEQIPRRAIQRIGDAHQDGTRDAIGAAFVFLDLLKRHADSVGELCLAHAQDCAAIADTLTDLGFDGFFQIIQLGHRLPRGVWFYGMKPFPQRYACLFRQTTKK